MYSQILKAGDTSILKTKYPVVQSNLVRSVDKVYVEGTDFDVTVGDIVWKPTKAPAPTTPLVCHYLTHPTYRITEHPHMVRTTLTKFKQKAPLTPQGEPIDLPVQGVCRYEFLL